MPNLATQGVSLFYDVQGDGPPLVLVHGSAVDGTTWAGVVPELAQTHRVITYDRRGYGRSVAPPVRDHRLHARDLVALLREVAGEPALLVGWSSGGNVALAVAAQHPELVASLVVVEAPFHGLRHANADVLVTLARIKANQLRGRRVAALEAFLRFGSARRSGGNAYDSAPEEIRAELRRFPEPVLAEWDPHPFGIMHEHVPLRAVIGIEAPILWILGGDSVPWLTDLHDRVVRRRPSIRTVVVDGASHLVHLDRPEGFVEVVRSAGG